MQQLDNGEIRQLPIRRGEPVLDPAPVVFRTVRFGRRYGILPQPQLGDYAVNKRIVRFLVVIRELRDGEIEVLRIRAGLPVAARIIA